MAPVADVHLVDVLLRPLQLSPYVHDSESTSHSGLIELMSAENMSRRYQLRTIEDAQKVRGRAIAGCKRHPQRILRTAQEPTSHLRTSDTVAS
jgi:hypothetical protein